MDPIRQPMRGKRVAGLVVSLIVLFGGAAYAYHLTVTPVVVHVDDVEVDCRRIDGSNFVLSALCARDVDSNQGRRALAGGAAVVGAAGLLVWWRSRFTHDGRIVGDRVALRLATATDRRSVEHTMSEAIIEAHGWTEQETKGLMEVLGLTTLGHVYLVEPIAPSPHEGQVVGCMIATPGPDGAWWIGGWIGAPWQQLGFGTDAAATITGRLFEAGIRNVHAECSVDNQAVRSMLEHIGFEHMGEIRTRLPNDRLELAARYAKHTTLPRG